MLQQDKCQFNPSINQVQLCRNAECLLLIPKRQTVRANHNNVSSDSMHASTNSPYRYVVSAPTLRTLCSPPAVSPPAEPLQVAAPLGGRRQLRVLLRARRRQLLRQRPLLLHQLVAGVGELGQAALSVGGVLSGSLQLHGVSGDGRRATRHRGAARHRRRRLEPAPAVAQRAESDRPGGRPERGIGPVGRSQRPGPAELQDKAAPATDSIWRGLI